MKKFFAMMTVVAFLGCGTDKLEGNFVSLCVIDTVTAVVDLYTGAYREGVGIEYKYGKSLFFIFDC